MALPKRSILIRKGGIAMKSEFNLTNLLQEMYELEDLVCGEHHIRGIRKGTLLFGNITLLFLCLDENHLIGCWQDPDIAIAEIQDWLTVTRTKIMKISKDESDSYPHVFLHTNYMEKDIKFLLYAFPINQMSQNIVVDYNH